MGTCDGHVWQEAHNGTITFYYISRKKSKYVTCQQDFPGGPIYAVEKWDYENNKWKRHALEVTPTDGKWDHEDPVIEQTHGV